MKVSVKIDFETIVKQDIRLNLSEIVYDIEYIPLETKKECLIGEVDGHGNGRGVCHLDFTIENQQISILLYIHRKPGNPLFSGQILNR